MNIEYTYWPSLYATNNPEPGIYTQWEAIAHVLGSHFRVEAKDKAPGFGPYTLKPGKAERKNENVAAITMAVFDADQGKVTPAVAQLEQAGLNYAVYSTFSYPEKHAYRLVIPLAKPLAPDQWESVRADLIRRFLIPAHLDQCKGVSHFYFWPAARPGAATWVKSKIDGEFLELTTPQAPPLAKVKLRGFIFDPPPEPAQPEDLEPYRKRMAKRAAKLSGKDDAKAALLVRALDGAPLAKQGQRNARTTQLTGTLAWMFPEAPLSTLMRIVTPSLEQMQARGSKITCQQVESMFLRAMKAKAKSDAEDEALLESLRAVTRSYGK